MPAIALRLQSLALGVSCVAQPLSAETGLTHAPPADALSWGSFQTLSNLNAGHHC